MVCAEGINKANKGLFPLSFMQVFHWSRQAGNYAFLESRDQCLHGLLGSVVSFQPVRESR